MHVCFTTLAKLTTLLLGHATIRKFWKYITALEISIMCSQINLGNHFYITYIHKFVNYAKFTYIILLLTYFLSVT